MDKNIENEELFLIPYLCNKKNEKIKRKQSKKKKKKRCSRNCPEEKISEVIQGNYFYFILFTKNGDRSKNKSLKLFNEDPIKVNFGSKYIKGISPYHFGTDNIDFLDKNKDDVNIPYSFYIWAFCHFCKSKTIIDSYPGDGKALLASVALNYSYFCRNTWDVSKYMNLLLEYSHFYKIIDFNHHYVDLNIFERLKKKKRKENKK